MFCLKNNYLKFKIRAFKFAYDLNIHYNYLKLTSVIYLHLLKIKNT